MKRLAYLATLPFIALLMLVPTAGHAQENKEVVKVSIRDFYFEPSQLIIEPGTTVQWVNEGATQHTVFATSPAGRFLSGTLNPGESYTYTFPKQFPNTGPDSSSVIPGTYRYYCEFHPDIMKAGVTLSEPEEITAQQPPTVPKTGGPSPMILLSGLLVVMMAVGFLGWAIKRRFL